MLLSFLTLVLLLSALPWAISAQADPPDDIEGVSATYAAQGGYVVVDTGQDACYDNTQEITCPQSGEAFYGQDAQYTSNAPSYTLSDDGLTVYDNVTGLTWVKRPDVNDDGDLDADDEIPFEEAQTYADTLNAANYGGYNDWRVPTIKELVSLVDWSGVATGGSVVVVDPSDLRPLINTDYFDFSYGNTDLDYTDGQYWSSNQYVGHTMGDDESAFGMNFADGHLKSYPITTPQGHPTLQFVRLVRGNTDYGVNDFTDNGDGTITDSATGLMWAQSDHGEVNWEDALAYAQTMNAQNYLGHDDWRLPNVKELHSIVDYTRSPDTSSSAAIHELFTCTQITNMGGEADYPYYWTGTTFPGWNNSYQNAIYIAFGRALGYMNGSFLDVHGAGAQRQDPKDGNPEDYPTWFGEQGDVFRVFNYVRLVRDASGDDVPTSTPTPTPTGTPTPTVTNTPTPTATDVPGSTATPTPTATSTPTPTSTTSPATEADYVVVDTGQDACYDNTSQITCPQSGEAFYGQDAQCTGNAPSYTLSTDGLTVYDNVTGLTWTQSPDLNGDGDIAADDKLTPPDADTYAATLNTQNFGGYNDWRLPTIKELYSLIDYRGGDPSSYSGTDTSGLTPFIDTDYFAFGYGDTDAGERIIDAQYCSSTVLEVTTPDPKAFNFGVNFADGRIKGYNPTMAKYVRFVRGNTDYGVNQFADNGDGTITDSATGLMWTQADSGEGMNWEAALAWVQTKNSENYLGHDDWRLPDAKELQSIVDYTRSPDTTSSAAIASVFTCTQITNEGGQADYPFYWTGTTLESWNGSGHNGVYITFGRALGYDTTSGTWRDVHGAGAQRADPKEGEPNPYGHGPQGDVVRIYNYVRVVRDVAQSSLPGDVNGDCVVDIVDIMLIAVRWGTHDGDANYDPYYDLDHDGDIDIVDIMLVAAHWGETCD